MYCILKVNIIYNSAPNKGCLNCYCSAILLCSNLSNSFRGCKKTSSENTSPLWPQSHLLSRIFYENFMKPWQMVKVLLRLGRIYVSNNHSTWFHQIHFPHMKRLQTILGSWLPNALWCGMFCQKVLMLNRSQLSRIRLCRKWCMES